MSESRHYYSSSLTNASSNDVYLGFANLPNQVHRKSVKKGFEFSLMVVGESGLGKSTLINSLFGSSLYKNRKIPTFEELSEKTLEISSNTVDIEERGIKLKLTVVDTPGYGDKLNNFSCFSPILNYIDEQYKKFFDYENGLNRKHITDTRIHCCFYFISPIGYGLKPIDKEFMKKLHTKVNIIPIIAKADALTKDELAKMKKKILNEIQENGINIYTIPDCDSDEEESYKEQIKQIRASVPFAISSSTEFIERGKKVLGRQYNWGAVEMENCEHSDFVKIRSLLVIHMQDLREVTNEVNYENYRSGILASRGNGTHSSISLDESEPDKDRILQEKEEELRKMQEMILQMKQKMMLQQKTE